jgi:hypothetical protein
MNNFDKDLEARMDNLHPELTNSGKHQAQMLIDTFKEEMKKAADGIIGDLYCDVAYHIESDSWTNYKNHLLNGLCDYHNRRDHEDYDFKRIRKAILEAHREEIIADLNQDSLKEIEELKAQIEFMNEARHY